MNGSILVVDDDPFSVVLTTTVIECMNVRFSLGSARNGKEALDIVLDSVTQFPLLILLDLNMPVMDGFEFLEALESLHLDKPVYTAVLTSSIDENDVIKARSYNIVDYIEKPLTSDKMREVINKTIDNP